MLGSPVMNRWNKGCWYLTFVAMGWGLLGCDDRARQEGEEGNLQFYYLPADGSTQFDRPLAVGSAVQMYLEPINDRELDQVRSVSAAPQSVLTAAINQNQEPGTTPSLVLSGQGNGEATISVEVSGGGQNYTDSTSIRVSEVRRAELRHSCTDQVNAAYLRGTSVRLEYERQNSEGEKLIGSARGNTGPERSCQVEVLPQVNEDQMRCNEAGLHFPPFSDVGSVLVDLLPGIQPVARRELGVQIVYPDEVFFEDADGYLVVDATRDIRLNPVTYHEDWPVCTNLQLEVEILTPNTCTGRSGERRFTVDAEDENQFRMRGVRQGQCEFEVVIPQIDNQPWFFEVYVEAN